MKAVLSDEFLFVNFLCQTATATWWNVIYCHIADDNSNKRLVIKMLRKSATVYKPHNGWRVKYHRYQEHTLHAYISYMEDQASVGIFSWALHRI